MKCPKCGNSVPQNAKFCGVCGTTISAEQKQDSVKAVSLTSRKLLTKKNMILGAGVVVSAAVILFLSNTLKSSSSNYVFSNRADFFVLQEEDEIIITHTGGNSAVFEGEYFSQFSGSLDFGKGAVAIINETNDDDFLTTFYYISESGIKAFADAKGMGEAKGKVSADGTAVVFASGLKYGYESDQNESELRIFDGDKVQTISLDFYSRGKFCISPDGKTVVYTANYSEDEFMTYIWNNGKSTELGKNLLPMAVSNGGKLFYFLKDNKWYVQKGKNVTKLTSDEGIQVAYLNKDNSEILFRTNNKTYICVNGEERRSLEGEMDYLLLPDGVNQASAINVSMNVNIGSFVDSFYASDFGVYRITKKYDSERAVKANEKAILAEDGKTVFYLNDGTVYSRNGFEDSAKEKKIIDDFVAYFDVSSNGKMIQYLTYDGDLYYQKGEAKPTLIDYGLRSSEDQFVFHDKSNTIFYINDGELFSSKIGEKASLVSSVDLDHLRMITDDGAVAVYDENYKPVYWTLDGKTFQPVDKR